jgi:membrane protease YdiL (CAAX protease family)
MIADRFAKVPVTGVASTGHTALLLLVFLVLAVQAAMGRAMEEWPRTLSEPGARVRLYLQMFGLLWVWVAYVWFGVRRAGGSLRSLLDAAPWTAARWFRYTAIGLAGFVFWLMLGAALGALLPPSAEQLRGVAAMLPHTPGERLLWVAFALSAGICEEILYRGYLLRQFGALARNRSAAVVIQAVVYGLGHLALPFEMVVSVTLLGLLLGVIAVWQKSLGPGMILHSCTGLMAIIGSLAQQ